MVLNKEEFFAAIKEKLGEDTDDASISFLENVTDTYNDLETKIGTADEWKKKYEESETTWRKKYTDRFFSKEEPPQPKSLDDGGGENEVKIEDLFVEKGEK
jgi:hypothetical protein